MYIHHKLAENQINKDAVRPSFSLSPNKITELKLYSYKRGKFPNCKLVNLVCMRVYVYTNDNLYYL